jgi:hypothetical protein
VTVKEFGTADLANCRFVGNTAGINGGAVWADSLAGLPIALTGCVVSASHATQGGGVGGDIAGVQLRNCILWGNTAESGSVESAQYYGQPPDIGFCCVQGWTGGFGGTGNIGDDPVFVDADGLDGVPGTSDDDLRLSAASPCIDAGDPDFTPAPGDTDLDGRKRGWDGNGTGTAIVDMGAYEFGSHCYGDLDCDGLINPFDIDPFVLALVAPGGYAETYPNCDAALADVNSDGLVNPFDIDPFVLLLTGD